MGYLNRDEGWYLLAGKWALAGEVPYRDFPYFQTPLLPYVYGGGEVLFGPTIIGGRLMGALIGLGSLVLLLYIARRIGGSLAAVCAGVIVVSTPSFVFAIVAARSESLVVLLVLAAVATALARPPGILELVLTPAILLVAAAARLSFLPVVPVALAYCVWRAHRPRMQVAGAALALGALGAVLFAPFVMLAPQRAWFGMWTAQATRNTQFNGTRSFPQLVADRMAFLELPVDVFFVVLIPALIALLLAAEAYRRGWRPSRPAFGGDILSMYLFLTAAAVALWLPFAGFDHQEDRYFVPSFALLAILAGDLVVRAAKGLLPESARLVPGLMAVLLVVHLAFQYPIARTMLDGRDVRETVDAGGYIAGLMGPGDELVSLNPTLALASEKPLAPELMMGQFSFWPAKSTAVARRQGVVNAALLEQLMLGPRTKVIALDDYDLSVIALGREEDPTVATDAAWPFKLFPSLIGGFRLVDTRPSFGQFNGTLYILERVS
ncbi:MAG: hypothetical protein HYX50_01250, partial [Chloroflexi bacterium]|nr:hypothetical protein [Chloroflexota bacterium]